MAFSPTELDQRLTDAAREFLLRAGVDTSERSITERVTAWREQLLSIDGLPDLYQLEDDQVEHLVVDAIDLVTEFLDAAYLQMGRDTGTDLTLAVWEPNRHPRWPKGTPGVTRKGNALAGKFMETPDLFDRLASSISGTADVSFLTQGATKIKHLTATKGRNGQVIMDATMSDGSKHAIVVPREDIPSHTVLNAIAQVENVARGETPRPISPEGSGEAPAAAAAGAPRPGTPAAPQPPAAAPEAHAPGQTPAGPDAGAGSPEPRFPDGRPLRPGGEGERPLRPRRPKPAPEPAPEPPRAPTFDAAAWALKSVPDRVGQFQALAPQEREALADPTHSIPARIDELVGPEQADVDAELHAIQRAGLMAPTIFTRLKKSALDLRTNLNGAGAPKAQRDRLVHHYVRYMAAQEAESQTRTLGDHGLRHLLGDSEMAKQIIDEVPGYDSPADYALLLLAGAFHDAGYLTPPSRIFLDKDHPEWSTTNYDGNLQSDVLAALGEQRAETLRHMIETHAGTEVNWKDDAMGSAFRLADNLALFHAEKMPPIIYHVPANAEVLGRFGGGNISLAEARAEMLTNINGTDLPAPLKARLVAALDELSPFLPKNALGMLGGRIDGFKWQAGHLQVDLHRDDRPDNLARVLDVGQRQFKKLAEAYFGPDGPARFRQDNRLNLNHPRHGNVVEFRITGDPVPEPVDNPPVPYTPDLPPRDLLDAAAGLTDIPPPTEVRGSIDISPGLRISNDHYPTQIDYQPPRYGTEATIVLPNKWREMGPAERRAAVSAWVGDRFSHKYAYYGSPAVEPGLLALTSLAFQDAAGVPLVSDPGEASSVGFGVSREVSHAIVALRSDDWQDAFNRFPGVALAGRIAVRHGYPLHPEAERFIRAGDFQSPYRAGAIPVNPEHVAAVDARLASLRRDFASNHSLTEEDYLARLAAQTTGLLEGRQLAVRVRARSMTGILRDGQMRPVIDSRTTGAGGVVDRRITVDEYIDSRSRFERNVFGIPTDEPNVNLRPIYAYLTGGDPVEEYGMSHYGEVVIVLKPGVRDRATFTMGDSLDSLSGALYAGVPMPIESDPIERTRAWMVRHDQHDPLVTERPADYVEAQIHSDGSVPPVALSDIAEIHYTGGSKPSAAVKRALREAGIEWRSVETGAADVPNQNPALQAFHTRADAYGRAHGGERDDYYTPTKPEGWQGLGRLDSWGTLWRSATAKKDADGFFHLPADIQRVLSPDGPPAHADYDEEKYILQHSSAMSSGHYERFGVGSKVRFTVGPHRDQDGTVETLTETGTYTVGVRMADGEIVSARRYDVRTVGDTPWDRISDERQRELRRALDTNKRLADIPESEQAELRQLARDTDVDLSNHPSRTAAWEAAPPPPPPPAPDATARFQAMGYDALRQEILGHRLSAEDETTARNVYDQRTIALSARARQIREASTLSVRLSRGQRDVIAESLIQERGGIPAPNGFHEVAERLRTDGGDVRPFTENDLSAMEEALSEELDPFGHGPYTGDPGLERIDDALTSVTTARREWERATMEQAKAEDATPPTPPAPDVGDTFAFRMPRPGGGYYPNVTITRKEPTSAGGRPVLEAHADGKLLGAIVIGDRGVQAANDRLQEIAREALPREFPAEPVTPPVPPEPPTPPVTPPTPPAFTVGQLVHYPADSTATVLVRAAGAEPGTFVIRVDGQERTVPASDLRATATASQSKPLRSFAVGDRVRIEGTVYRVASTSRSDGRITLRDAETGRARHLGGSRSAFPADAVAPPPPTPPAADQLEVGQRARIVTGSREGESGTITRITTSGDLRFLTVRLEDGSLVTADSGSMVSDSVPAPFFDGEQVTWGEGQTGVVEGRTSDGGVRVLTPTGTHRIIHASELRRAEPTDTPQFQVGATVFLDGSLPGTIISGPDAVGNYRVRIGQGQERIATASRIESRTVEPDPTGLTPQQAQQVQDVFDVAVEGTGPASTPERLDRARDSLMSEMGLTEAQAREQFRRHGFAWPEPAATLEHPVGTRLRISDPQASRFGQYGKVVARFAAVGQYQLRMEEDGRVQSFAADEVQAAPATAGATTTLGRLAVGDRFVLDGVTYRVASTSRSDGRVTIRNVETGVSRHLGGGRAVQSERPPEPVVPSDVVLIDGAQWRILPTHRADGRVAIAGPNGERRYLSAATIARLRGGGTGGGGGVTPPPQTRVPHNQVGYAREFHINDIVVGQSGLPHRVLGFHGTRIQLLRLSSGVTSEYEDTIPLRYVGTRGAHTPPKDFNGRTIGNERRFPVATQAGLAGRTLPAARRVPPPPPPTPRPGDVARNADNVVTFVGADAFNRQAQANGHAVTASHLIAMFDSPTLKQRGVTVGLTGYVRGQQVEVSAKFNDRNGGLIGTATRFLYMDTKTVDHSYLKLNKQYENGGITKDLFASMVSVYNDLGMKKIKVHANIDVGGYAWGRYGFVAGHSKTLERKADVEASMRSRIRTAQVQGHITEAQAVAARATMLRRLAAATDMIDLAALRISIPPYFVGERELSSKAALLGSDWNGTLSLTRTSKSWKHLVKYLGKKGYTEAQLKGRRRITSGTT